MFYIILVHKNFRLTVDFFEGLYGDRGRRLFRLDVRSKVEVAQDRWQILIEHEFLRWTLFPDWKLFVYL